MSSIHIEQDFDSIAACVTGRLSGDLPAEHDIEVGSGEAFDRAYHWCVSFQCTDRPDGWVRGNCPADQVPLVMALARATLREIARDREFEQSKECMNQYAVQVTQDFEVLTWLRNLAMQFEFCDVRNSMVEVVGRVLPSLRSILGAASIQYLPPINEDAPVNGDASVNGYASVHEDLPMDEGTDRLDSPTDGVIVGAEVLTAAECRELVRGCEDEAKTILVLNASGPGSVVASGSPVRQCMIARLGNEGERFGSIVVLNRSTEVFRGLSEDELKVGGEEFGTVEAGRLQSVVTMLVTHGRNLRLVHEKDALLIGAIRSLIRAIDAKDAYTFGHSDRVALYAKRLAIEIGLSSQQCKQIYTTGLLHDIGKIGVPDSVLGKPGRLTDEEFELIKQHPTLGYKILRDLQHLDYTLGGVLHHHEHYDGTGYPKRLAGDDIPLFGRILAVADAYDAMTSDRPYRDGMPTDKAESILRNGSGTQWDPIVVDAMMAAISDIHEIRQSHGSPQNAPGQSSLNESTTNNAGAVEEDGLPKDLQLA